MLDLTEAGDPGLTVTRFRPGLVLQHDAANEIRRYFIGGLVPNFLFDLAARGRMPVLPLPSSLTLQFVHASDVADAVVLALRSRPPGAINLAAEPPMTPRRLDSRAGHDPSDRRTWLEANTFRPGSGPGVAARPGRGRRFRHSPAGPQPLMTCRLVVGVAYATCASYVAQSAT